MEIMLFLLSQIISYDFQETSEESNGDIEDEDDVDFEDFYDYDESNDGDDARDDDLLQG